MDGRWRALTLIVTTVCAVAGSATTALARTGLQRAQAFSRAEVAYYAHGLPARLRSPALPGSKVDTECFSAADNHIDPGAGPGARRPVKPVNRVGRSP